MKEHVIKIAKKEFPLLFSLGTLQRLEETIKGFDLSQIDETLRTTKGLLDVMYCFAAEGATANDQELKESRAWFGAHAPASRNWIVNAHETIVATLIDGMSMETDDEEENEEVDVVLEELKKKDEKTD